MKHNKKNNNILLSIHKLLFKSFICICLFLIFLICSRKSNNFRELFYEKVYNSNISFAKINHWYESHFGSLFPINTVNDVLVFNESLVYDEKEKYNDGVLLKVSDNYLVPSINNGIVVFIGEKNNYGKTIIVEDETGLDIWYSNIKIGNINIYDYVNKGDYLGEVNDGKLIMLFQKKGIIEDYNKYI